MDHSPDGFDFVSQQALNILATQAAQNASRAVVLAGSYFLGREIQRRLKNCEVIWMSAGSYRTPDDKTYPLSKRGKSVGVGNDEPGKRRALILACPLGHGDDGEFNESLVGLPDYRSLHVLTYGRLSWLRPEWRLLRTSLSGVGLARAVIRQAGWAVDKEYGIYGLRSAAWGYLAKWWAYLGRQDLADRCYYAVREGLVDTDGRAGLAVLVVAGAKRRMRGSPVAVHE